MLQQTTTQITPVSIEVAHAIEVQIPEFSPPQSLQRMQSRLQGRKHLCLAAYVDGQPVGYKIGYEEAPGRFYSWMGGVLPEYRKRGIARDLLHHQEERCRAEGYNSITVKTMNQFRGMLLMLIQEGYDIAGLELSGKIVLRKDLGS